MIADELKKMKIKKAHENLNEYGLGGVRSRAGPAVGLTSLP